MSHDTGSAVAHFWNLVNGLRTTQALFVAASLGVADVLDDQPRSAEEIAVRTGADPASLKRLLRALATFGICATGADGRFTLADTGRLLRRDAPRSVHAHAVFTGAPWHWNLWGSLLDAVRTGRSGCQLALGSPLFDYLADHPDDASTFDDAMSGLSRMTNDIVLAQYDFARSRHVVDIGGGHGAFLLAALESAPSLSGTLFERPPVIEAARAHIQTSTFSQRVDLVGGDFFESVPRRGGLYILEGVLH